MGISPRTPYLSLVSIVGATLLAAAAPAYASEPIATGSTSGDPDAPRETTDSRRTRRDDTGRGDTGPDGGAPEDTEEERAGGDAASDDDARIETRADAPDSVEDPRFPSGFVGELELDDTFERGGDLGRALVELPGVHVRRSGSTGQPAYLSIRGGNPRQLTVLFGGMQIDAPAGPGFDIGGLGLFGIDGARVYRGSAASIYGAGALTGALELRRDEAPAEGWRGEAAALGGSFGTAGATARMRAGFGASGGADVAVGYRRSSGDFGFVDEQGTALERLNNDTRRFGMLAGGHWSPGSFGQIRADLWYDQGASGAAGPSEFQSHFTEARRRDRRLVAATSWRRRRLAAGDWGVLDASAGLGGQWRGLHYYNEDAFLGGAPVGSDTDHTAASAHGALEAFVGGAHLAQLRLRVRHDDFRGTYRRRDLEQIEARRTSAALTLADEWLLAGGDVSLVGSVRGEVVRDVREVSDHTRLPLVPAAGALWRALDWMTLRANIARTWRNPDFDELFLDTETLRGNPELEPERALTLDAGVVLGGGGRWRAELVYFRNHIDQAIYFLPVSAYLVEARNLGDAFSQGLEASGALRWRRLGLRAAYTFTHAYLVEIPGASLPSLPAHRLFAAATLDLGGLLALAPGTEIRARLDARSSIDLDAFGNLHNPAFTTVGLGATAPLPGGFTLGLDIHNLLDRRGGLDALQRPLPGRAFFGSLRYRFEAAPRPPRTDSR